MFDQFSAHFRRDTALSRSEHDGGIRQQLGDPHLQKLLLQFGGTSFNNGLYRVMAFSDMESASGFVSQAFPDFANRVKSFAYDWLGRVFALDPARQEAGSSGILMLEPGTGQALEIPCNLATFHNSELVSYTEEALAAGFYEQWLAKGGAVPNYDHCIGYKKPLFLGGKDDVENLEQAALDVYWTLCGQLIQKTRGFPPNTRVTRIGLDG